MGAVRTQQNKNRMLHDALVVACVQCRRRQQCCRVLECVYGISPRLPLHGITIATGSAAANAAIVPAVRHQLLSTPGRKQKVQRTTNNHHNHGSTPPAVRHKARRSPQSARTQKPVATRATNNSTVFHTHVLATYGYTLNVGDARCDIPWSIAVFLPNHLTIIPSKEKNT